MPLPTLVSLEYDVNIVGSQSQANVHAELEGVPLDYDSVFALGYGLVSDTTTDPTATETARTIVLSLIQPELQSDVNPFFVLTSIAGVPTNVITNFIGSIFSSSANDTAGGTGAQTVTIHYLDALGGAHSQVVALEGRTPVSLVTDDHATILSILLTTVGSFGTSEGNLTLTTASATPVADCCPPNLGTVVASLPAGAYVSDPTGTGPTLAGLFTGQLEEGTGSPIIAQLPVFS